MLKNISYCRRLKRDSIAYFYYKSLFLSDI